MNYIVGQNVKIKPGFRVAEILNEHGCHDLFCLAAPGSEALVHASYGGRVEVQLRFKPELGILGVPLEVLEPIAPPVPELVIRPQPKLPAGYRWLSKGEVRLSTDLFAVRSFWKPTTKAGVPAHISGKYIRKEVA